MNIQKMMKQAQEMQRKLGEMQAQLEASEMEGTAGGGAVKLTLSGKGALLKLSLDASVVNAADKDMLEDLIIAAHNDAKQKIDDATADAMGNVHRRHEPPRWFGSYPFKLSFRTSTSPCAAPESSARARL